MTQWTLSSLHRKDYSDRAWDKVPPDPAKCCQFVSRYEGLASYGGQCKKARGYGPEQAYCKTHDPEAVKAKRVAAEAKWRAEWNARERPSRERSAMLLALEAIAAGHNDPRALAAEVLRQIKEGTL